MHQAPSVQNVQMPGLGGRAPQITSGPRFEVLVTTLADAARALSAPLTDDEIDQGWDESLRARLADQVNEASDALSRDPEHRALFEGWLAEEGIEATVEDDRWNAAVAPSQAASDLDRAQEVLVGADRYIDELEDPANATDLSHGFTREVRASLLDALMPIRDRLARGDYLEEHDVDAYRTLLSDNGFLRRFELEDSHGTDDDMSPKDVQIVAFPPGRQWELLCIFDISLAQQIWYDDA